MTFHTNLLLKKLQRANQKQQSIDETLCETVCMKNADFLISHKHDFSIAAIFSIVRGVHKCGCVDRVVWRGKSAFLCTCSLTSDGGSEICKCTRNVHIKIITYFGPSGTRTFLKNRIYIQCSA